MEERDILINDTPYSNRSLLLVVHFFFTFISRMWDMGIIFLIAELTNNSLFLISLYGLLSSIIICIAMPVVGLYLDKTDRLQTMKNFLVIKLLFVSAAYLVCAVIDSKNGNSLSQTEFILLYSVPLIGSIVSIAFNAINQAMEKDWVVVLANGNSNWLMDTNSYMSQIDLICASLAPALTGLMFGYLTVKMMAIALLLLNFVSVLVFFLFVRRLYHSWAPLSVLNIHRVCLSTQSSEISFEHDDCRSVDLGQPNQTPENTSQAGMKSQLRDFMSSGCVGVMISYAFLFLTVLSFGSIMTVYLRWASVSDGVIGTSRGVSSITGYVGALIYPSITRKVGLVLTAMYAICFQFILVSFCASSFFWAPKDKISLILILSVIVSRTGLWLFDLCAKQLAQERIPAQVRGSVNGVWRSVVSLFESITYLTALVFSDPKSFWFLSMLSCIMVGVAMLIFAFSTFLPEQTRVHAGSYIQIK